MTFEQALAVMTDQKDPLHKKYKENNPSVVEEVDRAFQQRFGTHEVEVEKITMGGEEKNG